MKKKLMRGFSFLMSTILASSLVLPFNQVAFAEELDEPVHNELIEEYGTTDLITFCAGEVSNYYGYLTCNLSEWEQQCTIIARVASNNVSSTSFVDCYFRLPNGSEYSLGLVAATGGETSTIHFQILPPGEYKFIFESSVPDAIEVSGFIYG